MILLAPQELQHHTKLDCPNITFIHYTSKKDIHNQKTFFQQDTLLYVQKGFKSIQTHSFSHTIKPNEYLLIPKGSYTFSNITTNQEYQASLFFFKTPFLPSMIEKYKLSLSAKSFFLQVQNSFLISDFIASFLRQSQALHSEALLNLKAEELFLLLLQTPHFKTFLAHIQRRKHTLLDQLNQTQHLFDSVGEMAKTLKLDQAIFSRKFKEEMGISPKEWLDQTRLIQAQKMLLLEDKNISQVATELNFSSCTWFIKRFKEQFGITPKQFQKQSKNQYFLS